jgi:hypothetical protein
VLLNREASAPCTQLLIVLQPEPAVREPVAKVTIAQIVE